MGNDVLALGLQGIRGTDSNSLLRRYDLAKEILRKSPLQQERARAETVIRRLAAELKRRNVPL